MALAARGAVSQATAARCEGKRFEYKRREPQATVLHELVREHLEPFLAYTREHYRKPLPKYVERELRRYISCGDLRAGFTRIRCPRCRHEFLVGFSCGGRSVCPSCSARRMAAASVHLADRVLPNAPVRQWVLSVPFELRLLLASKSEVLSAVIRIVMRVVLGFYRERARELGLGRAETGAVSFVQRFGGSLNAHTHLHACVIDGAYTREKVTGAPVFHFVAAPTHAEIEKLASVICERVCRMLRRRGLLGQANHESNEAGAIDAALDACRKLALSRGRFERIDEQGRAQQELFADELVVSRKKNDPWVGEHKGFSLHAGVSFGALDRKGREKLIRYCTRPPIALGRLSVLRDGSIAYKLKYKSRGGRTHRVMQPMELMARLASLVAPPRIPLTRYHGCLAPRSSCRAQIVPAPVRPDSPCEHRRPAAGAPQPRAEANSAPQPETLDPPKPSQAAAPPPATPPASAPPNKPRSGSSTSYVPWELLMRRMLGIEVLQCVHCLTTMRAIAVITKAEVIDKILSHVQLAAGPQLTADGYSLQYDVTGEPMPRWAMGVDPEPDAGPEERGPPSDWDGIDPPPVDE